MTQHPGRTDSQALRILQVIPSLDPRDGGPAEGLKRSIEVMDGLGHANEVVCLDPPAASWLGPLPFRTHALGPGTRPYGYSRRLAPFISERRAEYDVAILHSLWNYSSVGGWLGLRGGATPYVVFAHGMMDPWFKRAFPAKHVAKQLYWLAVQGRVLMGAHSVLFTTEEERRLARQSFFGFGRYREAVVGYGAAPPDPDVRQQAEAFSSALPQLRGRRFLLFLGRIHPKKGCDLLLSAFAEIAGEDPELDLVIAGPDGTGWRKDLERLAAGLGIAARVHWPGMLGGAAKWGAFRAAEAFVLPSHQENFGVAVAEALACATPVLITDKVNIWRVVEAAGAGFVATDDRAGIATLLRRHLALSSDEKAGMREAARRCFERNFDMRGAALSLLDVLGEAAGKGAPGVAPPRPPP